ncbi:MAG: MCE family protein [Acidimicrobiales bacterium]
MLAITERRRNIISGLIALVLLIGAVSIGISASFGRFDDTYEVKASFDAAGQGLQHGSDVKIRGVNIGKVSSVKLVDGRAAVFMDVNSGQRIPMRAEAVVRPKTLFGEKFVDIVPCPDASDPSFTSTKTGTCAEEGDGPFYGRDGKAQFANDKTLGGFELERVLSNAYPLLQQIDPAELGSVLSTLADSGKGLGDEVNRTIVNGQKLADIFAAHDADQRQFFSDLSKLSTQLGARSDDLVALANSLNVALPPLNSRSDQLNALLVQLGRLSNDTADLLAANKPFIDAALGPGDAVIQLLYDRRGDVIPLVQGLRTYIQTLAEVVRIPLGDGTYMAAVKGLLGGAACALLPCAGVAAAGAGPAAVSAGAGPVSAGGTAAPATPGTTDPIGDLFAILQGLGGAQ